MMTRSINSGSIFPFPENWTGNSFTLTAFGFFEFFPVDFLVLGIRLSFVIIMFSPRLSLQVILSSFDSVR